MSHRRLRSNECFENKVVEAGELLEKVVTELEPEVLEGRLAERLVCEFSTLEKLCAAGKALCAAGWPIRERGARAMIVRPRTGWLGRQGPRWARPQRRWRRRTA